MNPFSNVEEHQRSRGFYYRHPWRSRQNGPPKRCYPTTTLHSAASQKIETWN